MGKKFEKKTTDGWTLVKEYPLFNLWIRDISGVRECFWKDEVPTFKYLVEE